MTHTISVDDATFVTLKKLANESGRTIVGQLRWLLSGQEVVAGAVSPHPVALSGNKDKEAGEITELQQMVNRLKYFEEGSPEYEEALERIIELQKEA